MALIKCKECSNQVSTKAASCPQCGARAPKKSGRPRGLLILGLLVAVIIGGNLFSQLRAPGDDKRSQQSVSPPPAVARTPDQVEVARLTAQLEAVREKSADELRLGLRWNYRDTPDKMGRGTEKVAWVKSINTVQFGFPYTGEQRATLSLRISPKFGRDVILIIEKGQFLCRTSGCLVSVRFDDGKPIVFTASEPEDHSTTALFIDGYDRIVRGLRTARAVAIEAQFYQEGTRVFEFNPADLQWPGSGPAAISK